MAFNIIGDPVTPDKVVLPRGVPAGIQDLVDKSATDVSGFVLASLFAYLLHCQTFEFRTSAKIPHFLILRVADCAYFLCHAAFLTIGSSYIKLGLLDVYC